jgi:hypothetical protein
VHASKIEFTRANFSRPTSGCKIGGSELIRTKKPRTTGLVSSGAKSQTESEGVEPSVR